MSNSARLAASALADVRIVPWDVDGRKGGRNARQRLTADGSHAFGPLNATLGGLRLTVSPVPEPATAATLLIGLGLLLGALRRRR